MGFFAFLKALLELLMQTRSRLKHEGIAALGRLHEVH